MQLDETRPVANRSAQAWWVPRYRRPGQVRTWFADATLVVFLGAQLLDGALTYVGVTTGAAVEQNPLIVWYMAALGVGPALAAAKMFAAACAIALHLGSAHLAIAGLTVFYTTAAILPWSALLFL